MLALAEFGPDASMEQIATVAGIAKPKIYRHFDDKADLVNAVGERLRDEVLTRLVGALDPTASVRETFRGGLDAFFGVVEDHPNTVRLLMDSAGTTRPNAIVENSRMIAALLTAVASADLDSVQAPTDAVEPLVHALIGAVLGATDWWLLQPSDARMPRGQLVAHLEAVLLAAAEASLGTLGRTLDLDAPLGEPHLGLRS